MGEPARKSRKKKDASAKREMVRCHISGRRIPREDAKRVKLGVGQHIWMEKAYFRKG